MTPTAKFETLDNHVYYNECHVSGRVRASGCSVAQLDLVYCMTSTTLNDFLLNLSLETFGHRSWRIIMALSDGFH